MERIGAVLVDTYRIERLIAEGGMGAVYEASHLRIPKKFAIKFLKISLLDNSVALLRFRREAEVIATLDHPHIVGLFDYNLTDDGVPYTVLEYVEGEHLGDRVSRGRLPLVEALRITEAVAGALSAAHDKGIVHRDLKPENVILGTKGGIKVVDFGIAKLRGGQELTAFNSILGTITYMAPEQLLAGKIDARADQFALAAMVYEMLSGDMPFGSEGSIAEIAERVLRHQPASLSDYPAGVQDVLLRGMAKEAAQRYASIDVFYAALREVTRPIVALARGETASAAEEAPATKSILAPAAAPPARTTTGAGSVELITDVELPELPGEATAISMTPTTIAPADGASPAIASDPLAPEETKITDRGLVPTLKPAQRAQPVTGRMSVTPSSLLDLIGRRIGRRGGIAVGMVIGVLIAVAASLLWR